jgi:hypothetical protein
MRPPLPLPYPKPNHYVLGHRILDIENIPSWLLYAKMNITCIKIDTLLNTS